MQPLPAQLDRSDRADPREALQGAEDGVQGPDQWRGQSEAAASPVRWSGLGDPEWEEGFPVALKWCDPLAGTSLSRSTTIGTNLVQNTQKQLLCQTT